MSNIEDLVEAVDRYGIPVEKVAVFAQDNGYSQADAQQIQGIYHSMDDAAEEVEVDDTALKLLDSLCAEARLPIAEMDIAEKLTRLRKICSLAGDLALVLR